MKQGTIQASVSLILSHNKPVEQNQSNEMNKNSTKLFFFLRLTRKITKMCQKMEKRGIEIGD